MIDVTRVPRDSRIRCRSLALRDSATASHYGLLLHVSRLHPLIANVLVWVVLVTYIAVVFVGMALLFIWFIQMRRPRPTFLGAWHMDTWPGGRRFWLGGQLANLGLVSMGVAIVGRAPPLLEVTLLSLGLLLTGAGLVVLVRVWRLIRRR